MKNENTAAELLFKKSIATVINSDRNQDAEGESASNLKDQIVGIFNWCIRDDETGGKPDGINEDLFRGALNARKIFYDFYQNQGNQGAAESALKMLSAPDLTNEEKAAVVSQIWAPETAMDDDDIVSRWRLTDVRPNSEPIGPAEIMLQLNALYTLPDPAGLSELGERRRQAEELLSNPGRKLADYDHPVHLFERDDRHEVVGCLRELDSDMAFEKERGVLPADHTLPVLLSVSVTHANLDKVCGEWITGLIRTMELRHVKVFVLTEEAVDGMKTAILKQDIDVFSVFGKYGVHFNALKYAQLLFEGAYGIRAGFKLDTDEGIRSRELYSVTGKTWLQTLCHELWGGSAVDWRGRRVELACNLGEYMNEKDITRLGYKDAMREPDVKPPAAALHGDIFFNKGAAHGNATALYNRSESLQDHISHTVVKGGGYGITNEGLRKAVPFTFSLVGRAEDQQFYFSGISRGIRGIFHPDLRIAHYKGAVATSEQKTAATRFVGDMYRLVIFQHLAALLDVKEDIDPMPGIFAGGLARCQAFYHTLYKALQFLDDGDVENAEYLMGPGLEELAELERAIDAGEIEEQLQRELEEWQLFIAAAGRADGETCRSVLEGFAV